MSSPPENKSVFSDISSFSPWASRNATPKLDQKKANDERKQHPAPKMERGGDHAVSHSNRLSFKNYPKDCPPLRVHWYHAVDVGDDQVVKCEARLKQLSQVPKRKPVLPPAEQNMTSDKPPPVPKKYVPFSEADSRALEAAFQKWAEQEEAAEKERLIRDTNRRASVGEQSRDMSKPIKVPVNEDYLFDVDIEKRELMPAYWLGPVYDVRRGTWFSRGLTSLNRFRRPVLTQ